MPTNKTKKVMSEYKHGKLHSGSKHGPKVTSRKQAVAIAMSEQRQEKKASDSATLPAKVTIHKFSKGRAIAHRASSAISGAVLGGFAGGMPGAIAEHGRSTAIGAGIGAAVGGVGGFINAGKRIKSRNALVDRINTMQKKSSDNKYLNKLAEMADNKIQKDEKKIVEQNLSDKFFTRQKTRGC